MREGGKEEREVKMRELRLGLERDREEGEGEKKRRTQRWRPLVFANVRRPRLDMD